MRDDISDTRIVEAVDEPLDASADVTWAFAGEFADGVGGVSVAEHGEDEFAITGLEPVRSANNAVDERVFTPSAEVHVFTNLVEPVRFDR